MGALHPQWPGDHWVSFTWVAPRMYIQLFSLFACPLCGLSISLHDGGSSALTLFHILFSFFMWSNFWREDVGNRSSRQGFFEKLGRSCSRSLTSDLLSRSILIRIFDWLLLILGILIVLNWIGVSDAGISSPSFTWVLTSSSKLIGSAAMSRRFIRFVKHRFFPRKVIAAQGSFELRFLFHRDVPIRLFVHASISQTFRRNPRHAAAKGHEHFVFSPDHPRLWDRTNHVSRAVLAHQSCCVGPSSKHTPSHHPEILPCARSLEHLRATHVVNGGLRSFEGTTSTTEPCHSSTELRCVVWCRQWLKFTTLLLIKYRPWQVLPSTNVSLSKHISWRIDTKRPLPKSPPKQAFAWNLEHRRPWWRPWQLLCLPKSFLSSSPIWFCGFGCREVLSNTVCLHKLARVHLQILLPCRRSTNPWTLPSLSKPPRAPNKWNVIWPLGWYGNQMVSRVVSSTTLGNSNTYSSANTEWSTPTPWLNSVSVSDSLFSKETPHLSSWPPRQPCWLLWFAIRDTAMCCECASTPMSQHWAFPREPSVRRTSPIAKNWKLSGNSLQLKENITKEHSIFMSQFFRGRRSDNNTVFRITHRRATKAPQKSGSRWKLQTPTYRKNLPSWMVRENNWCVRGNAAHEFVLRSVSLVAPPIRQARPTACSDVRSFVNAQQRQYHSIGHYILSNQPDPTRVTHFSLFLFFFLRQLRTRQL